MDLVGSLAYAMDERDAARAELTKARAAYAKLRKEVEESQRGYWQIVDAVGGIIALWDRLNRILRENPPLETP